MRATMETVPRFRSALTVARCVRTALACASAARRWPTERPGMSVGRVSGEDMVGSIPEAASASGQRRGPVRREDGHDGFV